MGQYMLNITDGHSEFNPYSDSKEPEGGVVKIVSRQKDISIRKTDGFVFLDDYKEKGREDLEKSELYKLNFSGFFSSEINSSLAKPAELNDQEKNLYKKSRSNDYSGQPVDFYLHQIEVNLLHKFENYDRLEDYTFSLRSIYNYDKPQSHFTRKFTNIDKHDYDTLINEKIYFSRTIFGRIFYSLPKENQLEFVLIAYDNFKTNDLSEVSLIDGLELLKDYSERFKDLGRLLVESREMLENNFNDILDIDKIGFVTNMDVEKAQREEQPDFIADNLLIQVGLFKEAFEHEVEINSLIKQVIAPDQKDKEEDFKNKFKSKSWPVQIRL